MKILSVWKYDQFKDHWDYFGIDADYAPLDTEFTTHNVEHALTEGLH